MYSEPHYNPPPSPILGLTNALTFALLTKTADWQNINKMNFSHCSACNSYVIHHWHGNFVQLMCPEYKGILHVAVSVFYKWVLRYFMRLVLLDAHLQLKEKLDQLTSKMCA
jgi:hypothetical protein